MKTADRIAGLILTGVSVLFLVISMRFSPYGALFPRVIAIVLGGLSVLLVVVSFLKPSEESVFTEFRENMLPVLLTAGLMAAWLAFIELLGFLVTSLVCFSLISALLDSRRTPRAVLFRLGIVAVITVGFYLFFARLLAVPFPDGVLI